jgi:integrase
VAAGEHPPQLHRALLVVLAPPTGQRREFDTFTAEQVRRFLKAVRGDRLEALYVLAITTGMRQGELLGLRWQDVERRRLQLVRQLKTRQSRRAVVLSELAVTALVEHRQRQAAGARASGGRLGGAGFGLSQYRGWAAGSA